MTTNSTQSTDLLDRTPLLTTLTKASMGIVAAGLLAFIFVSEDILVSLAFHVPAFVGLGVVLLLLRFKLTELASAGFISLFWGIRRNRGGSRGERSEQSPRGAEADPGQEPRSA